MKNNKRKTIKQYLCNLVKYCHTGKELPISSLAKQEIIDILRNNISHPSESELSDIPFECNMNEEDLDLFGYYKTADEIIKRLKGV